MKSLFHFIVISILAVSMDYSIVAQIPKPGSEGKIQLPWMSDYAEALKKAETDKKPVLLDITTDWCGWSKKMERETFANPAVQKELRSFVLVRINPEANEKNEKIAESFGADGYPTLVIANFRGESVGLSSGYMDGKDFLEFLQRYRPLFKGNSLGYKPVQLEAGDALMKAVGRIPSPETRPASEGSFIVLDEGSVQIQANGSAKFVSRTATYVADPEKDDLPSAHLQYISSRQKARFRTVRILNTKGEGRELDIRLAKDEHAYSNQNVYWDARVLSLDLPVLKEGQILDVIEEREIQPIMTNQFYFRWNTGSKILLASHLTLTFPSSLNLQKRPVRCAGQVVETRNPDGTITWDLSTSNPQPYEPVLFAPPLYETWEGYDFYTPCAKDTIAGWFSGLCQGRDKLPEQARRKIAELKKANPNQTALLQAIMDWVTKDVRYVSVAFGASSHQPHAVAETLANLYGDCKDQSLLVHALCQEAGIPSALVLLDAYGSGFNEESPAIEMFNHCILEATADGKPYYLDPASGPAKIDRVPAEYAGSKALKLAGASGTAVVLPPYKSIADEQCSQTVVKLNPNGTATITETTQLTGQKAVEMRQRMKSTTPEKMRKYLEDAYKKAGQKLVDFAMTDANIEGDNYESKITYSVPRFGSRTAGGLVFKMGSREQESDWVATLNAPRTLPFWFRTSDASKLTYKVELPAGAVLKGRPESLHIDAPFMQAIRTIAFKDNTLSVDESTMFREARMEAAKAGDIYQEFRKLQDHREYSFLVEMPR